MNSKRLSFKRRTALASLLIIPILALLIGIFANSLQPVKAEEDFKLNLEVRSWLPIISLARSSTSRPILGVNFISSAEAPADEQQYNNGLATGATWNRWPIYWYNVELSPDIFDWSNQDAAVMGDIEHDLHTNAILLGTPSFYTTATTKTIDPLRPNRRGTYKIRAPEAATPVGLYESIFTDNTDIPGAGKQINPSNRWANFVHRAVDRYKPGGTLARANGWAADQGVTHWEMWNEPDLPWFWDSSLEDYARLLKVGYIAAKQADPGATILFGGLANNFERLDYYEDVLRIFDTDPLAKTNNYFHDVLATHSYYYAWQSWFHVYNAGQTMKTFGLDKPIWLNETGVPAWNDYPGPIWDSLSPLRATMTEQADFVIQSAFYATFAGADAFFHFQLYDGCGNQPQGTDFPPHDGGLCNDPNYPLCAGDANGLFRNPPDAACFRQHPEPETPRPNFAAYKVLSSYFNLVEPLWRLRPGGPDPRNGPQEIIAFYRPSSQERIIGVWARFGDDQLAEIPASNSNAVILYPDGSSQVLTPANGVYPIPLPGATNQNKPAGWDPTLYPIGGRPSILIERDAAPPTVSGIALVEQDMIQVSWLGDDNFGSGVMGYDVSVSINDGAAQSWLRDTAATSAQYPYENGQSYTFFVIARDRAGNESAVYTIKLDEMDFNVLLPIVYRN
jgi:hypothetical protein